MSALREYLKEQETQRPLTKIEQLIMLTAEMSGFLPEEAHAELERLQVVERAAREKIDEWNKRALEQVPPEYKSRNLESKYFRLDNEAAGLVICADELAAELEKAGQK